MVVATQYHIPAAQSRITKITIALFHSLIENIKIL